MARSHLTLAALATSAVADLDLVQTASFGTPHDGDFDSALLTGRDGRHWIIRIPRNARAEAEQSADLVALRAISTGVRTRLPFTVSTFVGQTPVSGTRALVYEFVYGSKLSLRELEPSHGGICTSVGEAIAAIHNLPTSFVTDAGLPHFGSIEALRSAVTVIDRAAGTGLVPATMLSRWERASEDTRLWQFQPTVINGAVTASSFLAAEHRVSGVLGWNELRVSDPATDLAWVLSSPDDQVADAVFDAYAAKRGTNDRHVKQRATLYSELEVAKWLLHGTETRNTEIVDDAVAMLTTLVDGIENDVTNPISAQTMPTMAVDEVEAFLDRSTRAV
jgi:aminoglycoside phosphotransferase (APT) family kinase protein